jgi:hypothetical protein
LSGRKVYDGPPAMQPLQAFGSGMPTGISYDAFNERFAGG